MSRVLGMRLAETILRHFVPFLANEVFHKQDGFRDFVQRAAEEGVKITLRGRASHDHPKQWRTVEPVA